MWTLHARWYSSIFSINVHAFYKAVWLYKLHQNVSGWTGSAQTPWAVHDREGKKGGLKELGVRWPGPPQVLWQIAATDIQYGITVAEYY